MLLCLLVAAVIALMILQLRKIKADSGKTPDEDVNDGNEHLIDGDNYDVTHDDGVDNDVYGVVNQVVSQGC